MAGRDFRRLKTFCKMSKRKFAKVLSLPYFCSAFTRAFICIILEELMAEDKRPLIFKILDFFPLFFLMLLVYNIVMLFPGDASELMKSAMFNIPLVSGATWEMQVGHVFLLVGLVFLFFELLKSTKTSTSTSVEHVISLVVFMIYFLEFLLIKEAGNSIFLLLAMMSLLDVIAGFSITIATARRDFGLPGSFGGN
jgi:hypothetical protein